MTGINVSIKIQNIANGNYLPGGDVINVWLVSGNPKASIAADVTDHRNGTYTAVTVLPWSGDVTVMAGIAHHREKFRMMFYIQRIFKTTHWFEGLFEYINASEATPCLPFPSLPGHSSDELCNFTELNGSPWYCGRPVKKDFLNCSHYTSVMRLADVCSPPLTPTENWLLVTPHDYSHFLIPINIVIHVLPDEMSMSFSPISLITDEKSMSFSPISLITDETFMSFSPISLITDEMPMSFSPISLITDETSMSFSPISLITDETSKSNVVKLPQLKCHERNMSLTFEENFSYGFFFHGIWRPLSCQLPEMTTESLVRCLKDTKVIYVGDSNSRKQFDILTGLVPCEDKIIRSSVVWHKGLKCENSTYNISIQFYPHSFPFFGSTGEKLTTDNVISEVKLMDSIPKDGKYIVHLHHFMHLAPFHLSLLESRLKLVRESIMRLLDRNPHVIVIYQSAHSVYIRYSMNGAFFVEIQRRILRGLGDRVMFMFTWPMTVAVNNDDVHPPICNSFTAYYMGHICGRT
ncbi:hypothetical protein Btru_016332 [Bulinus truncatus]|nr:hypothetical protein Btru_016332 [Bulinus truncatus]